MLHDDVQLDNGIQTPRQFFLLRILVALVQGALLYVLINVVGTDGGHYFPRWAFCGFLFAASVTPLILFLGLGRIRGWPLALWSAMVALLLFGFGAHAILRGAGAQPEIPPFPLAVGASLAVAAAIMVANVLVVVSVAERRLMPSYEGLFETAWQMATQLMLASLFAGVFWLILFLGAGLFRLLDVTGPMRWITRPLFSEIVNPLVVATSIHLTHVRPSLLRGSRWVALHLLSWLLPVLALVVLAFLAILPFVSMAPLWATHYATLSLIIAAGFLILLVNCAYQDGREIGQQPFRRWVCSIAAWELLALVGLAAWGLKLRVGQYGWSTDRITAAAAIALGLCYGLGYCAASVMPPWLGRMKPTNVFAAVAAIAVVFALASPVADPARLMVADQVARLQAHAISADRFDFGALRFSGARWGADALSRLAKTDAGPDADVIRRGANAAMAAANPWQLRSPANKQPSADLHARTQVYPPGRSLPDVFYREDFWRKTGWSMPVCANAAQQEPCIARFVSLTPGGQQAILFLDTSRAFLFTQDGAGAWAETGQVLDYLIHCKAFRQSAAQDADIVAPALLPDLLLGGHRFRITPHLSAAQLACP